MTTMFVQLRGVVYLLVLLHFCVCVVRAEAETSDEAEAKIAKNVLQRTVDNAYEVLAQGKSCLTLLESEIKYCNESVMEAKKAVRDTNGVDELISQKKENAGSDKVVELLKRVRSTKETANVAMEAAIVAVGRLTAARTACHVSYDNMDYVAKKLEQDVGGLRSFMMGPDGVRHNNTECERLVKNGVELWEKIQTIKDEVFQKKWDGDTMKSEGVGVLKKAITALKNVKTKLGDLEERLNTVGSGSTASGETVRKEKEEVGKVAYEGGVKLTKVASVPRTFAVGGVIKREEIVDESSAPQEKEKIKKEAEKLKDDIVMDVRDELQKREEEERHRIAEAIQAEENEEREREKKATEEKKKIEEQQKKTEEEKKKKIEGQRKAEEDEKKKIKEQKEVEEEEEERKIEEQQKKAEEEKAKLTKGDGAFTPALLREPLVPFAVMCVLGCTLVC
ncbi:uncharacterized protein TM35_000051030 [Trypanosoma theileri]|uniref:Uncharacterized protein n=1 Tax=Trypanosoma theileri TaxID=67003 RepID=A0A1X0P3L2_9TRYP|nr:uncharacterized protein TM35_000051030 [Trypanosoma theileri]ORC91507.1 hypothetical protein TM35_000051030 [Trypanosoma theileri]